jgi:NhaA family Na+:H+ antiporter
MQHIEIGLGVLAGLVFGKPVGIMMAALIAVKMGIARLPQAVSWRSLFGYACLAGIGFTMSLFVAMLAFTDGALWSTQPSEALSLVHSSPVLPVRYC